MDITVGFLGFPFFVANIGINCTEGFGNMTTATEEASKMWRELPEANKKKYIKMAENENIIKLNDECKETQTKRRFTSKPINNKKKIHAGK